MGEPTPATPASKYFAATVAMIAGAFFFAVGAGLLPIPGGPSNLHGPLWLLLCVGLAFFLAGLAILIPMLGHANDSGDLPALGVSVRALLDSLGATQTRIILTGDLDEYEALPKTLSPDVTSAAIEWLKTALTVKK